MNRQGNGGFDEDWHNKAECLGLDVSLFYPEKARSSVTYRTCREVCAKCSVQQECWEESVKYELGVESNKVMGFRAGLSPVERLRKYRQMIREGYAEEQAS